MNAGIIRELFEAVIAAYKEQLLFYSRWSDVLDTSAAEHNPKVLWKPPTANLNTIENGLITQSYTVDMLFLDQTATDRTATERDLTYERMQIIAAHVWYRFHELYLNEDTSYQGVQLALLQEGTVTFTAIWDEVTEMTTGCRMVATLSSPFQVCVEDYFNA